jgi:hypothetical protein
VESSLARKGSLARAIIAAVSGEARLFIKENGRYFPLSGYLKLPRSTNSEPGVGNITLLRLEIEREHPIQSVQRSFRLLRDRGLSGRLH